MAIFTPAQLKKIQDFHDNTIQSLSKPCKIWYQPKWVTCTNCMTLVNDTHLNNIGLHGGPLSTICPECNGTHKIQQEVTEIVYLEIEWLPKINRVHTKVEAPNVKSPYDVIVVKGFLVDGPKIQSAQEIQIDLNTAPITNARYILLDNIIDPFNITKGRYFMALLQRVS